MYIYTKNEKINNVDVVSFNVEIKDAQVPGTADIKAYRIGNTVTAIFGEQTYTGTVTTTEWDGTNGTGVIMWQGTIATNEDDYEAMHILFRAQNMIEQDEVGHIILWHDADSVKFKIGETIIEGAIA